MAEMTAPVTNAAPVVKEAEGNKRKDNKVNEVLSTGKFILISDKNELMIYGIDSVKAHKMISACVGELLPVMVREVAGIASRQTVADMMAKAEEEYNRANPPAPNCPPAKEPVVDAVVKEG